MDRKASSALFDLLAEPSVSFRRNLFLGALRHGAKRKCAGNGRFYLNIGHTGLNDPGLRDWVRRADVRPIYFVHDLIPVSHPQYCRAGERERHIERMRTVVETAAGVITNSQATIANLRQFASEVRKPLAPTVAAWLGSTSLPASSPAPADRPNFVTLGTVEARKNHILLLEVWGGLIEKLGSAAPRLTVVGQRGWEAQRAIEMLDREAFGDAVIEISDCDDAELARQLRAARALLFPSFAEGFGMPLIEAFQAGVPAIASDLPVFREIGQGIPDLLDPTDRVAWQRAIEDYSRADSVARNAQLRRLSSFEAPTWDDHFAKVDSWLDTL
ncbi:glycosyltransferase family 4 protein [Sphingomonas sp. SM33]|uniref:Glycosyltransferase family 4 protein n=1 Tax=Sphingomonas telluris TaxID=2907998 RepID=A0ABS9VRJ0_9SPHN|nr:glycosyltransferase family 1 protein [Sphingomonas telluris]MCH8617147.1 glycosyltransferase family 4 protein [Sphingomonas telluris]